VQHSETELSSDYSKEVDVRCDEPQVKVWPRGLKDEFPDGPPTAVVTHRGCQLVLRFAPEDFRGEGQLQELRLLPGSKQLGPRHLRQFAPQAELYLAYARSAMRIFGPEGTVESRRENFRGAADALRQIGGPGRGLSDQFYRTIAKNYAALVAEGEPHPIKALKEIHHVTISAASRWVKEARRRGYITENGGKTDAS
jgi:hypothetical protein